MPLKLLTEDNYRGASKGAVVTDGAMAHTHIALLDIGAPPKPQRCYVKFYPDFSGGHDHRGIVNEIIGHVVASAMGAPVPSDAGLIILSGSQLANRPSWADESSALCGWWVRDMVSPSIKAYYELDDLYQAAEVLRQKVASLRNEILSSSLVNLIIAFDDLIANVDRNIGNLLRLRGGDYVLIDHGLCLTSDSWIAHELDPSQKYPNKISEFLAPESGFLPFKHATVKAHENLVTNLEPAMDSLLKWLPYAVEAAESAAVESFIRHRASPGSITERLGLFI
ncbi:TPA: hypothetical protein L4885_006300 [Pseudomonas aeruginosa]|uniref:hypothetical protein n=1 Tax=Pseudomonas aeruginosa TaxID=287 RepID=UPI00106C61BA|nr:hypothetical protein [Pseudomonas aeruginosa]HBO7446406.1 hypothetical protein [Pseudomonas aeruginosa]HBO7459700.1 hypothetical protein [Pseudomonas aeruginosa]HBO7948163.1 hypothetical protein [Pseudomonas aeruginosa]HBO7961341.1 hypothetical protein [Pseudomonas aeruginosa]HBO7981460.1 hypothetical protein [Pseudomonas aeruginosa]